jgi:hypothetical protein
MDRYFHKDDEELWFPTANLKWIKQNDKKILMQLWIKDSRFSTVISKKEYLTWLTEDEQKKSIHLWSTDSKFHNVENKQEWREIEIEQC